MERLYIETAETRRVDEAKCDAVRSLVPVGEFERTADGFLCAPVRGRPSRGDALHLMSMGVEVVEDGEPAYVRFPATRTLKNPDILSGALWSASLACLYVAYLQWAAIPAA